MSDPFPVRRFNQALRVLAQQEHNDQKTNRDAAFVIYKSVKDWDKAHDTPFPALSNKILQDTSHFDTLVRYPDRLPPEFRQKLAQAVTGAAPRFVRKAQQWQKSLPAE